MARKRNVKKELPPVPPVPLQTPADILAFTEQIVAMEAAGRLHPFAARSISSLLQVAMRAQEMIAAGREKPPTQAPKSVQFEPLALAAAA